MTRFSRVHRSALFLTIASGLMIAGCDGGGKTGEALEITAGTTCSLYGMVLADYPGPKAQIHYAQGEPDFFCDTMEMFSIYLRPEQKKAIIAVFVQDMGKADWKTPQGHWVDARKAYYVVGSKREGSMGPTIASFAEENEARQFADQYGGKVREFSQVTPEMAVLDGGILHDQKM